MEDKDWSKTGEEIWRSVLFAVENQDYTGLSKNIESTVNKAVIKVNDTISNINEKINANVNINSSTGEKTVNTTEAWVKARKERETAHQQRQKNQAYTPQQFSSQQAKTQVPAKQMQYPQLYRKNPPGTYSGTIFKALGIIGTSLFGAATFILTIIGLATGAFGVWLANFCTTTCLGGSIVSIVHGAKTEGFVNRFKHYVKQIGSRQYCELEQLATSVGKKKSFVEKEIRQMIQKGFFLQGHLDHTGQTLITSDAMYENYLNAEKSRKNREIETAKRIEAKALNSVYPEKVQQILEEGERYIQLVHEANDAIPGEVMSQKLAALEDIMKRIFEQLKRNPASADDLQKLMKYYLPTTTKLIEAYKDMDGHPSFGENNIANTKKEIEDTLDVINDAFGRIFDDMFEDAAWDISTEISTMKTMLAKEGLTGERDFIINEK